jgi:hypothetical protein
MDSPGGKEDVPVLSVTYWHAPGGATAGVTSAACWKRNGPHRGTGAIGTEMRRSGQQRGSKAPSY